MTPEQLSETIVDVLTTLVADGAITLPDGVPTQVTVERPRQKGHGDYATNVALQLAKSRSVGRAPTRAPSPSCVAGPARAGRRDRRGRGRRARASSTSPSRPAPQGAVAADIVAAGEAYGGSDAFAGEKINLEFVSANPTGPIHIGGVRWAAVGDALGRIFEATGAEVTREYYFNDHGAQIDRFAARCWRSAQGRAGAGGRLRRRVHPRDRRRAIVEQRPDVEDLDRRRGAGGLPRRRRRADVRGDQGSRCTTSASTSTSTSTRTTCTSPVPSSAPSRG